MIRSAITALTLQAEMKYFLNILLAILFAAIFAATADAQCAVCTKTSLQLGEKPAQGMNTAILYLMFMPFVIVGFIGYRWWKNNKDISDHI